MTIRISSTRDSSHNQRYQIQPRIFTYNDIQTASFHTNVEELAVPGVYTLSSTVTSVKQHHAIVDTQDPGSNTCVQCWDVYNILNIHNR